MSQGTQLASACGVVVYYVHSLKAYSFPHGEVCKFPYQERGEGQGQDFSCVQCHELLIDLFCNIFLISCFPRLVLLPLSVDKMSTSYTWFLGIFVSFSLYCFYRMLLTNSPCIYFYYVKLGVWKYRLHWTNVSSNLPSGEVMQEGNRRGLLYLHVGFEELWREADLFLLLSHSGYM